MDGKNEQMYYADIIAALAERTIKRLWVALIAALAVIVIILGGFLWYLNQYDFESTTNEYSQDGRGMNIIGTNALNGVNLNGSDLQNNEYDQN